MPDAKIADQTIGFRHEARIAVIETQIQDLKSMIGDKISAEKEATALALASTNKATDVALITAERAAAKAELAADKQHLEAQISALKEGFSNQILGLQNTIQVALASSDKAVLKAETAAEKRFESVNEFRATLADQQRELATKSEVNLRFKSIEERLTMTIENARELRGRSAGLNAGWGYLVGGLGAVVAVVTLFVLFAKTSN